MTFSLIIPFHKDLEKLKATLQRVRNECELNKVMEVLLCHNGTALSQEELDLIESMSFDKVRFLHTDLKGIGAGYKLGITQATADYVILSASDLPFGWTDLQNFKKLATCDFAIGSKAHAESKVANISPKRKLASWLFLFLRKILLGNDTPNDSQGSLIIRSQIASDLAKECLYNNYIFSLEIASLYLKKGGTIVEVPVILENNQGTSSVSILKDGLQMLKDLFKLRKRLR